MQSSKQYFLYLFVAIFLLLPIESMFLPGTNCVSFETSPKHDSYITPLEELDIEIKFNQPVNLLWKGNWHNVSFFSNSDISLKKWNEDTNAIFLSRYYNNETKNIYAKSITGSSTCFKVKFDSTDILNFSHFILNIMDYFSTADSINYIMPAQSWITYTTENTASLNPVPPEIQFCSQLKLTQHDKEENSENVNQKISIRHLLSKPNKSYNLNINISNSNNIKLNYSLSTVEDLNGYIYKLSEPLNIYIDVSTVEITAQIKPEFPIYPVYESTVQTLDRISDNMWKHVSQDKIEEYFNLVKKGHANISLWNRPFDPRRDSLNTDIIIQKLAWENSGFYQASIKMKDATLMIFYGQKEHFRKQWYILWVPEYQGVSCFQNSKRNVYNICLA
ncbi:uncharacterized protein LOC126315222, partial [Schistocerca gregaria]|uniref:uncharacterized protein LOC126315222 n=1 Tax=Schistocerca gregaria TaxID=7010 RepID=UPI00211DE20D